MILDLCGLFVLGSFSSKDCKEAWQGVQELGQTEVFCKGIAEQPLFRKGCVGLRSETPGTNDRELGKHILLGVTNGQPLQSGSTAASGPSCSPEEVHHVREYQRLAPQPCQMVNAIRLRLRTNNTVDRETVPSLFVCSEAACRRPKIERANSKDKSKCLHPHLSQQAL